MVKYQLLNTKNTRIIAILISLSTAISGLNLAPASAQLFRDSDVANNRLNYQNRPYSQHNNSFNIPSGITIPLRYDRAKKILVSKDETLPITLTVAANVRNRQGVILIPYGTKVVGEIKPSGNGSQFFARYLLLNQNQRKPINARSRIITRTEVIRRGANTDSILQGTVIGAAAATIIAGVTGDTAIATEEVLGGAGLGALAGWVFGRNQTELISIYPNTDLDITFF